MRQRDRLIKSNQVSMMDQITFEEEAEQNETPEKQKELDTI